MPCSRPEVTPRRPYVQTTPTSPDQARRGKHGWLEHSSDSPCDPRLFGNVIFDSDNGGGSILHVLQERLVPQVDVSPRMEMFQQSGHTMQVPISQSSLAVRFTAKNGGYPGDVKI